MPSSPPQKTGSIEYPRHIMGPDPMSCDDIFKMFQSSSPLCGKQLSLRDHTTDTEKSTLGQELTTRFTSLHPLRDNVFTQNAPRQKLDFISDNKNHTTCSSLQSDTPEWRARSEPHVSLISINKQQNLDRILSSPIHEQVPGWSFRSASLAPLPSRQNIRGFMSSPPRSALTEWYPEKNTYASVLEGQNSHSFMPFASVANASTKRSLTPCLGQQPPLSSNSINSNNMSVNSISSDTLRFNNMSFNHIYMPVPPPMVAQAAVPKRKALQDLPSKRNVKKTRVGEYKDGDRVGESAPEIGVMNKGRKLLEKMGWKKGMGLGTGDGGITSPYMPKIRLTKAGLWYCWLGHIIMLWEMTWSWAVWLRVWLLLLLGTWLYRGDIAYRGIARLQLNHICLTPWWIFVILLNATASCCGLSRKGNLIEPLKNDETQ